MSAAKYTTENRRKYLSDAILGELESWPVVHRQIFILAHYRGQSIESVSATVGLPPLEVRQVLFGCERKLRGALRQFRDGGSEPTMRANHGLRLETGAGYLY